MPRNQILLVDDERGVRFGVKSFLETRGYDVFEASSGAEALTSLRIHPVDVVLLDQQLPDAAGVDLLPPIRELAPLAAIIILTGHGTIELAVRAIKEGAEQFLLKPVDLKALERIIENQLEGRRLRISNIIERGKRREADPFVGESTAVRNLREEVRRLQNSDSPILIEGPTGSGKGVLARWFHQNGARARRPFVDLNCAGLARDLLETELFGHEKGAFTGAATAKIGLMEAADKGTLFLDEIGDLEMNVQPKLLTAIEEKRFRRLGDVRDRHSDFRIIAATHHDLSALAHQGLFRLDLYFRLSTIPIKVPSLRERSEDIEALSTGFLAEFVPVGGRGQPTLAPAALEMLRGYSWPGNIRELRNVLERANLLGEGREIQPEHLRLSSVAPGVPRQSPPAALPAQAPPPAPVQTLEEAERQAIERALSAEAGHVGRAAVRLGVPRSTLYKRIHHFGLDPHSETPNE